MPCLGFRVGIVALLSALGGLSAATAQPLNDDCSAAGLAPLPSGGGLATGTLVGATASDANIPCSFEEDLEIDAFHTFTPTGTGPWEFRMCGFVENMDASISIHTACPPTPQNAVLGGCDNGGCGLFGPGWVRTVRLTAGVTYIVRIAAYNADPENTVAQQPYAISVTNLNTPTPANDTCQNAQTILPGTQVVGSTVSANLEGVAAGSCGGNDNDVWYTFTNPNSFRTVFTVQGRRTDASGEAFPRSVNFVGVSAFAGCGGAELGCALNNGGPFGDSSLAFIAEPNQTVLLRVAGVRGSPYIPDLEAGSFRLVLDAGVPAPPAPANDLCGNATPVASLPFQDSQSIFAATNDPDTTCNFHDESVGTVGGVWYAFTPAESGFLELRSSNTLGANSPVALFTGTCDGVLTQVGCAAPVNGTTSAFLLVEAGVPYRILVGSPFAATPPLNASVSLELLRIIPAPPTPVNDNCGTATEIVSASLLTPFVDSQQIITASDDGEVPCSVTGLARAGVWYTFTAPASGTLRIRETSPATAVTRVFAGGCDFPLQVACGGDAVTVSVLAGERYAILLARGFAPTSPFDVTSVRVEFFSPEPVTNDTCATATVVRSSSFATAVNTAQASNEGTADAPSGSCNNSTTGLRNSVYYTFVATANGTLTGTIDPSIGNYRVLAAVYSGECGALTQVSCQNGLFPLTLNVPVTAGVRYTLAVGQRGTINGGGLTLISINGPFGCLADITGIGGPPSGPDGLLTGDDFNAFVAAFAAGEGLADIVGIGGQPPRDNLVTGDDFNAFIASFAAGCP